MSATDATPGPSARRVTPAVAGVVALAIGSVFLAFPTASTRPGPWAVLALALVLLVGGGLVAGSARVAPFLLPAAVVAVVAAALPGLRAVDDVGGGGPAPGPVLLLVAALAGAALAAAVRRAARSVGAAGTGASTAARWGGVALVVVAGGLAAVRIGLDEGSPSEDRGAPRPGEELVRSILDERDGTGPARATTVVRGGLVEVAGDHVMVATESGETGETGEPGEAGGELGTQVIDARTGAVVWRDPAVIGFAVGTPDGTGFLVRRDGQLERVDAATGEAVWRGPGDVSDPTPVADGVAVLVDQARVELIEVLDVDSGDTVLTLAAPCPRPDLVGAGSLVLLCASAQDGEATAHVVAPGTSTPSWTGTVSRYGRVAPVGAGAVLLPTVDGPSVVVDAATGRERFTVDLRGAVVLDRPGEALVTLTADGVVTTRDATDGRVLGTVRLDPGPEDDVAALVRERGAFTVEGGRLVGSTRDGLGTAWSPAGEKRRGLAVWDLATGARVDRALAGPIVAIPDVLRIDTLAVVDRVVVVGEAIFQGPDAGRYTTVFTIGAG